MTVDLRHLRCFLAIADEGNVTRAAQALHVSQPALSRTLAQLEAGLGVRLVDRSTHHLELTTAGRTFAERARVAVRAFDAAIASAATGVPPLRFGISWSTATHSAAIVRAWNRAHPDRSVQVRRRDDRLAGLVRGDVDVALVRGPITEPNLRSLLVEDEPRLAALPLTHALAGASTLRLRDLARESLVVNTVTGTTTLELWPRPPRPTIAAETLMIDDWLVAIAAGVGIGITPASTATLHPHPDIVYVPIADAPPVPLVLVWPERGAHRDARPFVNLAKLATRHTATDRRTGRIPTGDDDPRRPPPRSGQPPASRSASRATKSMSRSTAPTSSG